MRTLNSLVIGRLKLNISTEMQSAEIYIKIWKHIPQIPRRSTTSNMRTCTKCMTYEVADYNKKIQSELLPPTCRIYHDNNLTAPCGHSQQTHKEKHNMSFNTLKFKFQNIFDQ